MQVDLCVREENHGTMSTTHAPYARFIVGVTKTRVRDLRRYQQKQIQDFERQKVQLIYLDCFGRLREINLNFESKTIDNLIKAFKLSLENFPLIILENFLQLNLTLYIYYISRVL